MPFRFTKLVFIFSTALAVLACAAYAMLWFFFITERAQTRAHAAAFVTAERTRAADTSLAALLSETAGKRSRIDTLFVGKDDTVPFLKELEQVGTVAGVKTTVIKVEAGNPGREGGENVSAGVETLAVTIEAEGDFASVYRFIALLEHMPRPLSFSRIYFTHNDEKQKFAWGSTVELMVWKIK